MEPIFVGRTCVAGEHPSKAADSSVGQESPELCRRHPARCVAQQETSGSEGFDYAPGKDWQKVMHLLGRKMWNGW